MKKKAVYLALAVLAVVAVLFVVLYITNNNSKSQAITSLEQEAGELKSQLQAGQYYADGLLKEEAQDLDGAVDAFAKAGDYRDAPVRLNSARFRAGLLAYHDEAEPSYEKALACFRPAAEQGHAGAQYYMGLLYRNGFAVEQSDEKALEYYQMAADQGYVEAQVRLAAMYLDGQGAEQSDEKAAAYYQMAADQGDAEAQYALGVAYEQGTGVEQSVEKAAGYYQLAADQGNAKAQNVLAAMYWNGQGVEQSDEKAVEYYQMAADQVDASGAYVLAHAYYDGRVVEQSYEKAAGYFRVLADQGDPGGYFMLGLMNEMGQGMEKSIENAKAYYEKAAGLGHGLSRQTLGNWYFNGDGVEKNYEKAAEYYTLASEDGYWYSAAQLGLMYENGYGVEQSADKALEYYRLSVSLGNDRAEADITRLSGEAGMNDADPAAPGVNPEDPFYIAPISDEIFSRIYGKSFKEDCTLPRDDLRYLHVLHVDLNGVEHEGEMIVNYHIAEDVLDILRQLYEAKYPIERIRLVDEYDADDELSMEDNNSSSFNFRFISHTTRVSKHGLGLAVDINTLYNPYTKVVDGERIVEPITGEPYLDRDADFPYKIDHEDLCFRLFAAHGFEWGGDWEDRKDYQHFEIPTDVIAEWYPDNQ